MSDAPFDLALVGGTLFLPGGPVAADLGIRAGRIAAIARPLSAPATETWDCRGLTVLPGVIDTQVHFREPGLTHKEDLETGTRAAALGGVTGVFEMPNTKPATDTAEAIADKLARARGRTWVDHAFYAGATGDNSEALPMLERLPGVCGVKIFMGSSTGSLLVAEDGPLERALTHGTRRVAIHAEDEARLRERFPLVANGATPDRHPEWRDAESARLATERILRLARRTGRRLHLLHISSSDELPLLAAHRDLVTVETTPNHLTLTAPDCYLRLGTLAQMNPPVREAHHRAALWDAIADGLIDVIGSDHAPHTLEEKGRAYPNTPSGMPGVQTLVPVMLTHVAEGRLSLARFVDLTSAGPARIWGMVGRGRIARGFEASLTLVDLAAERTITRDWIASRCGWSPFEGMVCRGWPVGTVVRGRVVMRDGALLGSPAGEPLRFEETEVTAVT